MDASIVTRHFITESPDFYQPSDEKLFNITITELLQQDAKKNSGMKGYKSCSLREKKMVLEK